MKKFLTIFGLFWGVPLLLLLGLYLWSDPFKTLHPFDIHDVDATNREYQSVELFKRNYETYHYNSFVFCSSQGSGFNTYTWKIYLDSTASPFLFQAWCENITGVKQKVEWLDKQGVKIENAMVLIDIPGFFDKEQFHTAALSVKHHELSGESTCLYHAREYYNFIQKPSSWIDFSKKKMYGSKAIMFADTITNDWFVENAYNYDVEPKQDSLSSCTEQARRTFFHQINNVSEDDVVMSKAVITDELTVVLQDIKAVFNKQGTEYYIIITPSYRYTAPYLNTQDLEVLQKVFGTDRVFDFTTDKELTSDYNDFFDPIHFGTRLGWFMLKKIYQE